MFITRLQPHKTKKRAPGPGPIRQHDWLPIVERQLKYSRVVLHTDGAQMYKTTPGLTSNGCLLHDHTVHQRKKIIRLNTAMHGMGRNMPDYVHVCFASVG